MGAIHNSTHWRRRYVHAATALCCVGGRKKEPNDKVGYRRESEDRRGPMTTISASEEGRAAEETDPRKAQRQDRELLRRFHKPRIAALGVHRDAQSGRAMRPWGNIEAAHLMMKDAAVESSTDLLVLMAIAHETEPEGPERGTGSPSVQKLQALTRLSTRSVQRCFPRLIEAGELEIDPKAGDEHTNVYRLPRLIQAPDPLPREPGINLAAMHCVMLYSEAGGNDLFVQMAIARFSGSSGKDKGKAYPGIAALADLTRLSEKTVIGARKRLQEIGELEIAAMPSRYGTNVCTIPMLQYRGARSTGELSLYVHILTNDLENRSLTNDLDLDSRQSLNRFRDKGSYGVDLTPGMSDRLEREICIRLADHLIKSGRKDPLYRTDAESFEWRNGAAYLDQHLSTLRPLWYENAQEFLDGLFDHIVNSDRWPYIRNPSEVHEDLDEILRAMQKAEAVAGVETDADPMKFPAPSRHGSAQQSAATGDELQGRARLAAQERRAEYQARVAKGQPRLTEEDTPSEQREGDHAVAEILKRIRPRPLAQQQRDPKTPNRAASNRHDRRDDDVPEKLKRLREKSAAIAREREHQRSTQGDGFSPPEA